jgi:ribosomal protein L12E/L44/L45/RPP1/RPP2
LSPEEITRLYGALRSELNKLSVQDIRNTVAAAGIDVSQITAKAEARSGLGSRAEVMPAVDRLFGELSPEAKLTALQILAERLVSKNPDLAASVQAILGRHGYQFISESFVPVGLLDSRESGFLPQTAASELARATARLMDGDESGAITAACGAVDLVTQAIYRKHDIGDSGPVSFQAKVNTVLKTLNVFEEMHAEFVALGMSSKDADELVEHFRSATNHAAQLLQVLRRTMGDVHGSRPALRRTAYDAIKWGSAICALLEGRT